METWSPSKRYGLICVRRFSESPHHGVRRVRIFGSVARGEATESSDLDLSVDWDPGRSLLDHPQLVQDLESLLKIKVHARTEQSLHGYVRDRILQEATPL